MTIVSDSLSSITGYTDHMAEKIKSDDDLGMNDFLTMLIAQLQHQDPLNPMESQDFTAQLTQFSQLEAQFKSNKILEDISKSLNLQTGKNAEDYLDKYITATVDTIDLTNSKAAGGFYTLEEAAQVSITVFDKNGKVVQTIDSGQKEPGSYSINWDGKDLEGNPCEDGTYNFYVEALTSSGYSPVTTSVSGKVDSIIYQGEKQYLVVEGVLVSPKSVVEARTEKSSEFEPGSTFDYLGKTIEASTGAISLESGKVKSSLPSFIIESEASTRVNILNSTGQIVYSYHNGNTKGGKPVEIEWDGKDQNGNKLSDGYYYYEVVASGNLKADTSVKGEVTGVFYENGRHFLDINGVRVAPEYIEAVKG
ncbi:MAG: FlgD immunoglobulin-like domain containing protein [Desulforegulaceae bacterium]|nr:FlgD immunoglobulin-like domain containing protein [Desulforegulaceae bacterium]